MVLRKELKELLIAVANLDHLSVDDIADTTSLFGEQFGLDSIDLLEFVVHLEKKYNIKVQNNDKGRAVLANIDSIAAAIEVQANAC